MRKKLKPQQSEKYGLPIAYVHVQWMDVGQGTENSELHKKRTFPTIGGLGFSQTGGVKLPILGYIQ